MKILRPIFLAWAALVLTLLPAPNVAQAVSLWSDNGPGAGIFADRKAHAVGDIITILINENSSASRTGQVANSKSSEIKADAGVGFFTFINQASAGASDSFKAQGSIANTNKVSAKITATVTEVKPNGNLVISGTQSIRQNGEEQRITVTGTVRPEDVMADNTVLSSCVADAQIRVDGHGPIARKQRQGVLSQIWNFLF